MSAWRRPRWWALVLTTLVVATCVRLGFWQLDRAAWKETLLQRYAAAENAAPVAFDTVATAPPATAFPRVTLRGRYLADRIYLLDNPKHDRMGGVEAYVPFAPRGEPVRLLLVDLGFLPGSGNGKLPQLPALAAGEVTLSGLYVPPPAPGFEMGGDAWSAQHGWPKSSIYIDLGEIAADLDAKLYPRVLALDPDPRAIWERAQRLDFSAMPPARHRAYAFQWFTFALAAVVILVITHRRRPLRAAEDSARDDPP